eukprot:gene27572-34016_t
MTELALCEALLGVDGVDPNVSNKSGTTPLVLAAGNGKVELVDALLADSRVDVNLVVRPADDSSARGGSKLLHCSREEANE